ncbi:MAG TPA: hypothetical protein VD815_05505 [Candidatus Saccharimonadales bacterium]|nr:hypothetical protein [Candidatus Saccharimonadales bacterium]
MPLLCLSIIHKKLLGMIPNITINPSSIIDNIPRAVIFSVKIGSGDTKYRIVTKVIRSSLPLKSAKSPYSF